MRQITVIMKPTSECNLRCRYCYHANTDYETGIMTEEVLDAIISKVQSEYNDIVYVWHGGEPLLCGLDFFRKALQLEHKYIRDPMRIRNCIQTNGILLSKEVLQFCLENRISVTVSLDECWQIEWLSSADGSSGKESGEGPRKRRSNFHAFGYQSL